MTTVGDIAQAKYVLLTTYRKDGTPRPTPLWAVREGANMVMWTPKDSWKVKRIRNSPKVVVQACDRMGKETSGPEVEGTAEVFDGAVAGRLIGRKYGLIGKALVFGSRLIRGADGTVGIRIRNVS